VNCARPSCPNVRYFEHSELCGECVLAEERAMFAVDFDHLARMDEHYPEHRTRHDRREKPKFTPYLVKPTGDAFGTAYGRAGLRNIIADLARREDRNNGLFFAARSAGELVAGGQLDGPYVLDCLTEAAEHILPDERWKSKDTIARGVRIGLENPRVPRRAA
jgi:hypothetical protein